MGEPARQIEPEDDLVPSPTIHEDLAALEREITPEYEAEARYRLKILREVYHGDRLAEIRAMKDGTHPIRFPRRGC